MRKPVFSRRIRSVSIRLPLLFVSSTLLMILIVVAIVFVRFRQRMINEYTARAIGVTNLMAMEIDPEKTEEYLEQNFESEEYNRILDRFYDLKNNSPDVLYMYVYQIKRDGAVVIFDLNSEEGTLDADQPGDIYDLDESFIENIDDLEVGNPTPAMTGDTEDGYLLTYCKPILDSEGNYKCHVCVDFSMEEMHKKDIRFVWSILIAMLASVIVLLFADILVIQKTVAGPLTRMKRTTDKFSYETDSDHENNIKIMEELDIHTGDEIEDIYHVFIVFMRNNVMYMKNFIKAQDDIKQKDEAIGQISRTAYRDALTGAGNKAAYNRTLELLEKSVKPFAIAVFDVNSLKYINDNYGHKAGDSYITGCCKVLTDIFGIDKVYRIGGDEFAVIITGSDYTDREILFKKAEYSFAESFADSDRDPWERWSMSGGMSKRASIGEPAEPVFRRADDKMYRSKAAFKEIHGSYR